MYTTTTRHKIFKYNSTPRKSYALYATDDNYLCSAIINSHILRKFDKVNDITIIIPINHTVSREHLSKLAGLNVKINRFSHAINEHGYYRDNLLKLSIFHLVEYEKIVYIDSDALVMKSLEHLFEIPISNGEIAAPQAYWLEQPLIASTLLVLKPAANYSFNRSENKFDMDILNMQYSNNFFIMPPRYNVLNSHWEINDTATFGNLDKLYSDAFVIHFTALGKPWNHRAEDAKKARPDSHPLFIEQFALWWRLSKICS